MKVNQNGHPVDEVRLFKFIGDDDLVTDQEIRDALCLLCDHLNVSIHRTNATKHGDTELNLRIN